MIDCPYRKVFIPLYRAWQAKIVLCRESDTTTLPCFGCEIQQKLSFLSGSIVKKIYETFLKLFPVNTDLLVENALPFKIRFRVIVGKVMWSTVWVWLWLSLDVSHKPDKMCSCWGRGSADVTPRWRGPQRSSLRFDLWVAFSVQDRAAAERRGPEPERDQPKRSRPNSATVSISCQREREVWSEKKQQEKKSERQWGRRKDVKKRKFKRKSRGLMKVNKKEQEEMICQCESKV